MTNALALAALGDPTRRAIFDHLSGRPSAVGELARLLPVSRPAVSQHLKVLKDAGLVTEQRDGNRRIYQLDPKGIGELQSTMLQHVSYWSGLAGEGRVVAFGPVDDPNGSYRIGIVLAEDPTEAERVRDGDPAMTSPHGFTTAIAPMLRLVTPKGQW